MKQGKVVILPMIFIAIFVLVSVIVGIFFIRDQSKNKSIFEYSTVEEILDDGYKTSIDDSFKLTGIEEFGYTGDGQIDVTNDSIDSIWFITHLSTDISHGDIKEIVTGFVKGFSDNRNYPFIDSPVKLAYCDEETLKNRPDDDYTALSEGYILYEYSYRDKDGVLWIVQVFSPQEGYLSGLIVKQINEEEFEGYIPQVDMRKE